MAFSASALQVLANHSTDVLSVKSNTHTLTQLKTYILPMHIRIGFGLVLEFRVGLRGESDEVVHYNAPLSGYKTRGQRGTLLRTLRRPW